MLNRKTLKIIAVSGVVILAANNLVASWVITQQDRRIDRFKKKIVLFNDITQSFVELSDDATCDEVANRHAFDLITVDVDL